MNLTNQKPLPHPTLFKALNPLTREEKLFENSEEAYVWKALHQDWVLKKQETVSWTFPLERIIKEKCWIKVD